MSPRNLCCFTVLAAMVALPVMRKVEAELRQSGTRTENSANIKMPPAVFLPVQSRNPRDLGPGKVLVASRELGDPNFAKTVVLLVHCDTESVIGLMINRRTAVPISRVFADLKTAKDI